jgi:N-carbamoylputrescine amidase
MRVTVCELPDEVERRAAAWHDLVRHLRDAPTDLLVLPEMPFVRWAIFTTRVVDPAVWHEVLADHDAVISRFGDLAAEVVVGSRPVEQDGRRLNQSFAWTRATGIQRGR